VNGAAIPSISAVLPAYNEEGAIVAVVEGAAAALRANRVPSPEILVVDDGSRDATAERARQAGSAGVPVRVVTHSTNRGYGLALRSGFESATGDAVWLMDSDGQFDPADLGLLLDEYAHDRVVAGYRIRRSDTWFRRVSNAAFFTVVSTLLESTARDVDCGFKLFPRALGLGLRAEGAIISTELLLRARHSGYRIVDVPVPHYPRRAGRSTGANPSVVGRAFRELWELRRDQSRWYGLEPPRPGPTGRPPRGPGLV
jgi:glycosyltransferase involved in cell wall biosynthesis